MLELQNFTSVMSLLRRELRRRLCLNNTHYARAYKSVAAKLYQNIIAMTRVEFEGRLAQMTGLCYYIVYCTSYNMLSTAYMYILFGITVTKFSQKF